MTWARQSLRRTRWLAGCGFVLAQLCTADAQTAEPNTPEPPHLLEGPSTPETPSDKAGGKAWQVQRIAMPEAPVRIYTNGALAYLETLRIETASGAWYGVADCDSGLCANLVETPHAAETLPSNALPGSSVAIGDGRIARAWLAEPVQRLEQSAIGPWVAGSLVVEDRTTKTYRLELALNEAFEDLRPRIADLDGDGEGTVFLVRASLAQGAALVAVRLEGEGLLRIVGETAPEGHPGGWLNPIGFGDFLGRGHASIAIVRSPDQGGKLQVLDFSGGAFRLLFSIPGVSNHIPGRPTLNMAVIADFDGAGSPEIAVPDAARKSIRIFSFAGGKVGEPADIALPAPVATEIAGVKGPAGARPMLLMGLEDGELVLVH